MLPVLANAAMTMAHMTTKLACFLKSGRHAGSPALNKVFLRIILRSSTK